MSADDQLLYESRMRPRQIGLAAAAGVLLMVASVVSLTGYHSPVSEQTLNLIAAHRRGAQDIIAAVINALAQVALAGTLVYLWRCARARGPRVAMFIPIIAVLGAVLAIVSGIVNAVEISHKASEFVSTGAQTYDEADRLTRGSGLLILQIVGQLASLLVAIAFVLVSLQSMRVGLLPKVLGYVGIVAGALVVFPLIVVPIVQLYWLLAVAYLLSGRWPSGLPAAWRSGRAEAWPSSAELRARRVADAEAARERRAERKASRRGGRRGPVADMPAETPSPAPGTESPRAAADAASPRPAKRKRKRRR